MDIDIQTHEIVLLGANFAGVPLAHYLLKHTLPFLHTLAPSIKFHLRIVSPNTHYYWKVAGPRAMISSTILSRDTYTRPISEALDIYPKDLWTHQVGRAIAVDSRNAIIAVRNSVGSVDSIRYDSLVIATGTSYESPLWTTEHGSEATFFLQRQMHLELPRSDSVLITGGGPMGVEAAGEIATNYPNIEISVYNGEERLLEDARPSVSVKAEMLLKSLGVSVTHDVKVTSSQQQADGSILVTFDDGSKKDVDVYIDAVNRGPNSNFLPSDWLADGVLRVDKHTLRVEGNGAERVYGFGGVTTLNSDHSNAAVDAVRPLASSLLIDIVKTLDLPAKPKIRQVKYEGSQNTMLVPVGKSGTGQILGVKVPGWLVHRLKGRTYLIQTAEAHMSGTSMERP